MTIANYISDLLYRYECVIIPDFGGFVTNVKSAKLNVQTNTFYPPYKAISFNSRLTQNDGLLLNYIANTKKCTYNEAVSILEKAVSNWKQNLETDRVIELDKLGSLSLNKQDKIVFAPQLNVNYLTTSYGLSSVIAPKIIRQGNTLFTAKNNQTKSVLKYAAVFVLGLTAIGFGNKLYREYKINKQIEITQRQQKINQNKIQAATFKISNPLPSITLENTYPKKYHVIAGAFREPNNAIKKLKQLKNKGFNASIIGKNKWGLTQVAFGSYALRSKALAELKKVRASMSKDAWLFIK